MTASTATRRGPATDSDTAGRLRARLTELRQRHPDWSDGQLRHQLQRDGFSISAAVAAIRGDNDEAPATPKAPEKKPPAPTPPSATPSRGGGSKAGGDLWQSPGTASGVLLALVAYPAFLAYLRGGRPGLGAWFRAKFLNQTDTDPGIANEAWLVPDTGTSGGAAGTAATAGFLTGRRRGAAAPAGAGAAAVAFARSQIGKPYRWGAAGPNAWDCSGLTQAAWRAAGVSIPRTTTLQLAMLPGVRRADLQAGDLVFPDPGHVQLYAGGGRIIEAPHTGLDVRQVALGRVMAVRRPRAKGLSV